MVQAWRERDEARAEVERLRWYEQQAKGYVEAWNKATADVERLRGQLGRLEWLLSSPGSMTYNEIIQEALRIVRRALDEGES